MHRKHQIAACCFLAFSAYLMWESWTNMEYYTPLGPGAGFFPFWLGALLGGLGIVWLVQVSGRSENTEEGPSLPPRGGIVRILSIVFSVAAVSFLLDLFTFGRVELMDGIGFVPVIMGLFGLAEILQNAEKPFAQMALARMSTLIPSRQDVRDSVGPILRGSIIGTALGLVPG